MYELADKKLDLYDDSGMEVVGRYQDRLEKLAEVTAGSSIQGPDVLAKLSNDDFAIVFLLPNGREVRKYAMHSPAHTALSGIYFEENAAAIPEGPRKVAAWRLLQAHVRHGIEPPAFLQFTEKEASLPHVFAVADLEEPELDKVATVEEFIPNEEFLLVRELDNGEIHRAYRVTNYSQCKEACETFEHSYLDLEPADRANIAHALMKEAEARGLEVSGEKLLKYASDQLNPSYGASFTLRLHMLGDKPEAQALDDLRKHAEKTQMAALEIAHQLEKFDRETGLSQFWDQGLLDPYASVLGNGKVATINVDGKDIPEQKIAELVGHTEKIADMFRGDLLAKFQDDPLGEFRRMPLSVQRDIVTRIS